jgi:hypothetical protein
MRELIIKMANANIGSLCLFLSNKKNEEYLNYLDNNIPIEVGYRKLSEKIYYFVNDINKVQLCICGEHKSFIGFKNGYRSSCGDKKCFIEIRKITNLEKYGVDNPKKSKKIIEKEKNNILKKWNGKHYMYNREVRERFNKTMISNYGVKWAQQSDVIKSKSIESWNKNPNKKEIIISRNILLKNKTEEEKEAIKLKKNDTIFKNWGEHYMNSDIIKNKISKKFLEKYGDESHFRNEEVSNKRIISYRLRNSNIIKKLLPINYEYISHGYNKNKTGIEIKLNHNICNNSFTINQGYFKLRINSNFELCLDCNPILAGKSKRELEVLDLIKTNYNGEILTNIKNLISGELDIYLPDLKIAFEFNGLYWHSHLYKDKLYHLNKTKQCSDSNISLIHIWEDDWDYKKDILRSIILNKLGKSEKIWARRCEIKEINDNKLVRDFLVKNHIQGFVGSNIKIGLYFNGELVSLMTFGNLRRSLGQKSKEGSYELLRFCNKLNTTVIGGSSKLLKYFLDRYKTNEIISYSDNSRGSGDMYKKLGFKLESETEPNYYWIIDGIRKHRFNFRKDKLVKNGSDPNKTEVEIMNEMGHYRIFDCGSKKWKLTF